MCKKLVKCIGCELCCVYYPAGFTSQPTYLCTDRREYVEVTSADGCTFGIKGSPILAVMPYDITLGTDAITYGADDERG